MSYRFIQYIVVVIAIAIFVWVFLPGKIRSNNESIEEDAEVGEPETEENWARRHEE